MRKVQIIGPFGTFNMEMERNGRLKDLDKPENEGALLNLVIMMNEGVIPSWADKSEVRKKIEKAGYVRVCHENLRSWPSYVPLSEIRDAVSGRSGPCIVRP